MANPKITSTGFVGDLIGTASKAFAVCVETLDGKGTTLASFQDKLKSLIVSGGARTLKSYMFVADRIGFVSNWNAGNLDYTIQDGTNNVLIAISETISTDYAAFLLSTYAKDSQYLVILSGGNWLPIEKVPSQADLTEIKAQITSASANYASKTHYHTVSQITDFTSSVNARISTNVTASNPTLSFGSTSTVGTIAGKNLEVTMPSDPTGGQFSAVSSSANTAVTWVKNNSKSVSQSLVDLNTLKAAVNRIDGTLDNVDTKYKPYSGSYSPLPATISLAANTCYDVIEPTASFAMTLPTDSGSDNYQKKYSIAVRIRFGSIVPAITWPSGVYWANGEAPTLEANTVCEVNFMKSAYRWCVAYQTFKEATA